MKKVKFQNLTKYIYLLTVSLVMLTVAIILMSLVPPVSRDALVHHLAVPKLYIEHGGIYEIPFMDFSYFPMNLDLLYMIPLYLGNDIAPKLIHFCFALLTALLIFCYLKKRAGLIYGISGALFFLSIPVIVKLSITAYVDLGVIFFSFASLLLILKWIKEEFKLRYLFYSGLMCGLALGTKYSSLITFILLTLFIPFIYSRFNGNKKRLLVNSLLACIVFAVTSLAVFSPWMIRNCYWKGNPVYPLYNKVFNPPAPSRQNTNVTNTEKKVAQNKGLFTYRHFIYGESGFEIALLPLRIFYQGEDDDPQFFDGRLNPFLLILALLSFIGLKNNPVLLKTEKNIMFVFSILFIFIAMFTTVMRIRYIAPVIPPLTVLSILGIKALLEKSRCLTFRKAENILVMSACFLFIISLALNSVYIVKLFRRVNPVPYITGSVSRDEYISRHVVEYPVIKYVNENLPLDSKVFFIYLGRRGYYCDRDYYYNNGLLHRIIKKADRADEILTELQKRGITHLLISFPVFDKWVKENCPIQKLDMIKRFFTEHTVSTFYKNGIGLNTLEVSGT